MNTSMNNDLFHSSQQQGIYHTISLWSRLSPRLVKRAEAKSQPTEAKSEPEDQTDKIDKLAKTED